VNSEPFYLNHLRTLLIAVKGPLGFADLRIECGLDGGPPSLFLPTFLGQLGTESSNELHGCLETCAMRPMQ
jgi:hypothetical protein